MNAFPVPWALADVWARLFGLKVSAACTEPLPLRQDAPYALGLFQDRQAGAVLAVLEPKLAAYAAAALPRIPAAVAKEAALRQKLTAPLVENFHEIMNVTCQIFYVPSVTPSPLTLTQAYQNQSAECRHLAMAARSRSMATWHVSIRGYEGGKITLVDMDNL